MLRYECRQLFFSIGCRQIPMQWICARQIFTGCNSGELLFASCNWRHILFQLQQFLNVFGSHLQAQYSLMVVDASVYLTIDGSQWIYSECRRCGFHCRKMDFGGILKWCSLVWLRGNCSRLYPGCACIVPVRGLCGNLPGLLGTQSYRNVKSWCVAFCSYFGRGRVWCVGKLRKLGHSHWIWFLLIKDYAEDVVFIDVRLCFIVKSASHMLLLCSDLVQYVSYYLLYSGWP